MQTHHQIHYTTTIKAPVDKVWQALTDPKLVKQYFFGSEMATDWKPGSPLFFRGEWEGKSYEDKGVVQEYVPNQRLSYSYLSNWSGLPDVPENYLLVGYQVEKVPDGTRLTITQTNYNEERAKHSESNWAAVITELKKLIE